jgi:hypothetical protein
MEPNVELSARLTNTANSRFMSLTPDCPDPKGKLVRQPGLQSDFEALTGSTYGLQIRVVRDQAAGAQAMFARTVVVVLQMTLQFPGWQSPKTPEHRFSRARARLTYGPGASLASRGKP